MSGRGEHTHPESIPPCPACDAAVVARHVRETGCEALREALPYDPWLIPVPGPSHYHCYSCRGPRPKHKDSCRWGKARAALAPTVAASETFHGQGDWPCACGHRKDEHYFGDRMAPDGSFGAWCQMDPSHCSRFRPAPSPATEAERRGGEDRG